MSNFLWFSKKVSVYLFTFSIIFGANTQILSSMSTSESQKEVSSNCEAENLDFKISKALSNVAEESGVILVDEEKSNFVNVIKSLIKNSKKDVDLNEFIKLFVFEVSEMKLMLIPMSKGLKKHEDCLMNIFCEDEADDKKKEYMKHYMGGKLFSKKYVEEAYCRGVLFKNGKISSLPLMIAIGDKVIARIGMGPLTCTPEIGYALEQEYSNRKIMTNAVKCVLRLLDFMKEKGIYNYEKLRATAEPENEPSNKILEKLNFTRSKDLIVEYGVAQIEYYYHFDKKPENSESLESSDKNL